MYICTIVAMEATLDAPAFTMAFRGHAMSQQPRKYLMKPPPPATSLTAFPPPDGPGFLDLWGAPFLVL